VKSKYLEVDARTAERLWRMVDKSGGPDACWPFTGSRGTHGYGQIYVRAKKKGNRLARSNRVAYAAVYGPIPAGLIVCHRCDNPPCCNPAHLFLGDDGDNARDRVAKGRHGGPRLEHRLRGEALPGTKLTDALVRAIRARRAEGETYKAIANALGLKKGAVGHVVRRDTWGHVA
jgi:hypothetical protein